MNAKQESEAPRASASNGDPVHHESLEPPTDEDLALESPHEERAAEIETEDPVETARRNHDRWLRAEAELQNFRRRAQRDREEAERAALERGLLETIAQLDDVERALAAARDAGAPDSWTEGVQLVARRMRDWLSRHGVTTIPTAGVPFDPNVHEALLEVEAPDGIAPGHVAQEVRAGYQRGDRVLRAARVVVARPPES